jgi:hypothetical protein
MQETYYTICQQVKLTSHSFPKLIINYCGSIPAGCFYYKPSMESLVINPGGILHLTYTLFIYQC